MSESLKDEMKEIKDLLQTSMEKKEKKFRMPFKGKVGKAKLKRGYVTIVAIMENKVVDFKRLPIVDGTYKMDETFHAISDEDIFFYKGKPLIFQPVNKLNPFNPLNGESETYGQKYVMARMKSDLIKASKKKLNGMLIFGVVIVLIGVYYFFSQSGAA